MPEQAFWTTNWKAYVEDDGNKLQRVRAPDTGTATPASDILNVREKHTSVLLKPLLPWVLSQLTAEPNFN